MWNKQMSFENFQCWVLTDFDEYQQCCQRICHYSRLLSRTSMWSQICELCALVLSRLVPVLLCCCKFLASTPRCSQWPLNRSWNSEIWQFLIWICQLSVTPRGFDWLCYTLQMSSLWFCSWFFLPAQGSHYLTTFSLSGSHLTYSNCWSLTFS